MFQNDPNLVIFKVKNYAVFEKLMGEECKVFIKVSLLCFSLAQGTILPPKLYLWCRREENLSFKLKNGQK